MIQAQTHVLGSRTGYSTQAKSSGLTPEEVNELATLGFGQTGDAMLLESFAQEPCAFGRPLRSGRFAITRCFAGGLDDAGRATLRLLTIVLEPADYDRLVSSLPKLVRDAAIWKSSAFDRGESLQLGEPPEGVADIRQADLVVLDAWIAATRTQADLVVLPDEPPVRELILSFPRTLSTADRLRFRWGVRLLGVGVPVDVCTVVHGGVTHSSRRRVHRRPAQADQKSLAAMPAAVALVGKAGPFPPLDRLRPAMQKVAPQRMRVQTIASATQPVRRRRVLLASLIVALLAAGLVGVIVMWSSRSGGGSAVDPAETRPSGETESPEATPQSARRAIQAGWNARRREAMKWRRG
jgi:hypothetical protein